MREKDEITGLFRSRLAGTEMTVREGFWEKLREDVASSASEDRKRLRFFLRNIIGWRLPHPLYLCWEPHRPLSGTSLRKRK